MDSPNTVSVSYPLRLGSGQNNREHWRVTHRRNRVEKDAAGWALAGKPLPSLPCKVTLTRVSPSKSGLDTDNLAGSLKATRDTVARFLGVDDAKDDVVHYEYRNERGPWGVRIEWELP